MKKPIQYIGLSLLLIIGMGCNDEEGGVWSIPNEQVLDGGPGKDGIPSVDNPIFYDISQNTVYEEEDLVVGYKRDTAARAYPHVVLDWHEIVNDEINGFPMTITYCPLTGTAIGWDRTIDGNVTTFGVSGLLYNSNLIPYDRRTNSNWSQMQKPKPVHAKLL